ncbi:DUF2975 domain-containing protein [Winogradskyella ursingii]|uniref:DUF2975 domain-containing protein n=1 Tax=Winogradskyella ursingii TaxID=2686079 RepID=UPI0015CA7BFF|nr:DUF2975 domain-containing protein [Winogradskyella ursingii]
MTKNTLLNIAILISRLLKIILIVTAIGLTSLFIYVQVDKKTFGGEEIILSDNVRLLGITNIYSTVWKDNNDNRYDLKPYTFEKLKTVSLYVNFFKILIIMILMFLIIRAFERVMLSVKNLNTFTRNNVKLFRRIGIYIVFVAILTSYTVLRFENGNQTMSHISLTPVICIILAFIMAEIFKEGEDLKQENNLTI